MVAAAGAVQHCKSVIGPPVSIGTNVGTGGGTTMTITTTQAIPKGALLLVGTIFTKSTTISVSSISDGTNSYSLAKSAGWDATNTENEELWYCANAAAIASGATITITYSATTTGTNPPIAVAAYCTGIATSSPLDKTASTVYAPGTAFSSGSSGTLTQGYELIIGFLGFYNAACTITEASGFTQINDQDQGSGARFRCHMAYQIVNATTAVNYQPTLSAANFGGSILASFKGI